MVYKPYSDNVRMLYRTTIKLIVIALHSSIAPNLSTYFCWILHCASEKTQCLRMGVLCVFQVTWISAAGKSNHQLFDRFLWKCNNRKVLAKMHPANNGTPINALENGDWDLPTKNFNIIQIQSEIFYNGWVWLCWVLYIAIHNKS